MLPKLTLVLGGADSGKTAFAERLVAGSGFHPVYLATGQAFDDEMRTKIDRHKRLRGLEWRTVEAPRDAAAALAAIAPADCVLLDCATMWLTNQLMAEADLDEKTDQLLAAITGCAGPVVVVSNELGLGVVPDNALCRAFRSAQGRLNQKLATHAGLAVLVVAGLPVVLKGTLPGRHA